LVQLLQAEPGLEVVGEAADGDAAVQMALKLRPDVVVMDISMPGLSGIEATERILSELGGVRIIGLSMYEENERGGDMLKAGASAYLHKAGRSEVLIATIKSRNPLVGSN
jgi:DNA-binding NarL/FixJ family response regulator